jgi:hypothetical protein
MNQCKSCEYKSICRNITVDECIEYKAMDLKVGFVNLEEKE